MKTLLLAALLLAMSRIEAGTIVTVAATPADALATGFRWYTLNVVGGVTNRTLVTTTANNIMSWFLADGATSLGVTATNAFGESGLSNPLYLIVNGTNVVAITTRPAAPIDIQLK